MYSHLDLSTVAVPKLPVIRLPRRRSSARTAPAPAGPTRTTPVRKADYLQMKVTPPSVALTPPSTANLHRGTSPTIGSIAVFRNDEKKPPKSLPGALTSTSSQAAPPAAPVQRRKSLGGENVPLSPATGAVFIVDKPPKAMRMMTGDHYFVPISVTSLRIELSASLTDPSLPPAELIVSAFNAAGKRLCGVSPINKVTKDKSIQHVSDDAADTSSGERLEVAIVNLNAMAAEVAYIFVAVSASQGRSFSETDKFTVRVVDVGFYPGAPELFSFEFSPTKQKTTTSIGCALVKEKWSGGKPAAQANQALQLWTAKAIAFHITQKVPKLIVADVEELAKRLSSGWLPVPKGDFQSGGDPSRIVGDRMFRKAQRTMGVTPVDNELNASWKAADTDESARSRRDSVESATPVDQALEELEQLFQMKAARGPNQGRPRVVRRNRCVYSVGRAAAVTKEKQRADSDEEVDSDEEELFRQVFEAYSSRRVVRYDSHCYNIGTSKDALLHYYLENRDVLDSTIGCLTAPRAPLTVDCVYDDDADDTSNFVVGPPDLALDEFAAFPAGLDPRDKTASPLAHSDEEGLLGNPLGNRAESFNNSMYEQLHFQEPTGALNSGDETSTLSGQLRCEHAQEISAEAKLQDSAAQARRFGPLKPAPPLDMVALRDHQEQTRKEEAERQAREAAARSTRLQARRNTASTGNSPPSSAGLVPSGARPLTFRLRGASAGQSKIPTRSSRRSPSRQVASARPQRRRQQNLFSGQLLQWIDAYMRRENKMSPTAREKSPSQAAVSLVPHPPKPFSAPPPLRSITSADPVLLSESSPQPSSPSGRRRTSNSVVFQVPNLSNQPAGETEPADREPQTSESHVSE